MKPKVKERRTATIVTEDDTTLTLEEINCKGHTLIPNDSPMVLNVTRGDLGIRVSGVYLGDLEALINSARGGDPK